MGSLLEGRVIGPNEGSFHRGQRSIDRTANHEQVVGAKRVRSLKFRRCENVMRSLDQATPAAH
jgi:hypothetical protein